jgi:hypothetical protein
LVNISTIYFHSYKRVRIFASLTERRIVARYDYKANAALTVFGFESVGRRGRIAKRVEFEHVGWTDDRHKRAVYNLAFGDLYADGETYDDSVVSDNGDMEQVLATVASTVYAFLEAHPSAMVLLEGSTPARTRLYRMGISKWLGRVEADFEVLGYKNDMWEKYVKGGDYGALLLQRKGHKFEHRF